MNDLLIKAAVSADGFNPFDGIHPSFGPFDQVLHSKVGMLLALVWAGAFCYCAYNLVVGIATMSRGRKAGIADAVEEGRGQTTWAGMCTIALSVVGVAFPLLTK